MKFNNIDINTKANYLFKSNDLQLDRRRQLAKQSKAECEDAKISVRNARRDAIEHFKKMMKEGLPEDIEKDAEASAQKIHDKYIKKIDEMYAAKEKEIMTV